VLFPLPGGPISAKLGMQPPFGHLSWDLQDWGRRKM
jgi:hypothetical protein